MADAYATGQALVALRESGYLQRNSPRLPAIALRNPRSIAPGVQPNVDQNINLSPGLLTDLLAGPRSSVPPAEPDYLTHSQPYVHGHIHRLLAGPRSSIAHEVRNPDYC